MFLLEAFDSSGSPARGMAEPEEVSALRAQSHWRRFFEHFGPRLWRRIRHDDPRAFVFSGGVSLFFFVRGPLVLLGFWRKAERTITILGFGVS